MIKTNLDKAIVKHIDRRVYNMAQTTERIMKEICPHDTGELRDSIYKIKLDNGNWMVGSDLDYAKFAAVGRGEVKPIHAQKLAWNSGWHGGNYYPNHANGKFFSAYASPYKPKFNFVKQAAKLTAQQYR